MKEQSRYHRRLWLVMLLVIVASVQAAAQDRAQTTRETNDQNRFVDKVYLITVTVSLGHQRAAVDLTKENFALSDNGRRQDTPFFARQPNSGNNDIVYALGYHPEIWLFNGKRRTVRVVVRDAHGKKLKVRFSPTAYPGTREFPDGP